MAKVRVTIKRRSEIDVEKLALALLGLAKSMEIEEGPQAASESPVIAEDGDLDTRPSKKQKGSSA
jgi:hypothetical protein